jgi:hypothetical protein
MSGSALERIRGELAAATETAVQSSIDQWYNIEGGPKDMPGEPSLAHYIASSLTAHQPTYLAALLDVAEAAAEAATDCRLAPDTARGRRWCVAHQEWTPCPVDDLRAALAALEDL